MNTFYYTLEFAVLGYLKYDTVRPYVGLVVSLHHTPLFNIWAHNFGSPQAKVSQTRRSTQKLERRGTYRANAIASTVFPNRDPITGILLFCLGRCSNTKLYHGLFLRRGKNIPFQKR